MINNNKNSIGNQKSENSLLIRNPINPYNDEILYGLSKGIIRFFNRNPNFKSKKALSKPINNPNEDFNHYLNLKWDKEHGYLPKFKKEELAILRKKFEGGL